MPSTAQALIETIQALPPEQVNDVEDFVACLVARTRRVAAIDRLLAVAPALEAAEAAPITENAIEAEVTAVRARRGGGAARS